MKLVWRWFACPESDSWAAGRLLWVAMLWSILLIANPGPFSHDELQKVDHILRFGFADYVHFYARLYQGTEFGQPVRPVSFLIQGLVSLFMPQYPVVGHGVDVLSHGLITVLVFRAVLLYSAQRQFAWVSALVFACSPLANFSVGWMAALMDRFYILFGLIAFTAALRFATQRAGIGALAVITLASSLAILSKETAAVLPATLVLLLVLPPVGAPVDRRNLVIAFALWCVPVLAYLVYRLPALAGSLAAAGGSAYAMSPANVMDGLIAYGIYPFLPSLAEAHVWPFKPTSGLILAGAAHLLLALLLWRLFSFRTVLLYIVSYFGFLAPVLLIPTKGAHYLYGSGLAFAVAFASILVLTRRRPSVWVGRMAVALLFVALMHSIQNQLFIYRTGHCMNTAAISMESSYLGAGRPEKMRIGVESGAPGHVLHRLTAGRTQIGPYFPVIFEIVDGQGSGDNTAFKFNAACIVSLK
jgi:hypothetical protein